MTDLAWFYRREKRDGKSGGEKVVALMSRRQMQSLWEIIVNPFWSYQGVIKLGVWLNNIKTTWRLIYNKCGNTFICKDCPTNMSRGRYFHPQICHLCYTSINPTNESYFNILWLLKVKFKVISWIDTLKYLKMTYLRHLKTAERYGLIANVIFLAFFGSCKSLKYISAK